MVQLIIAASAVALVALRRASAGSAGAVAALAVMDVALGAPLWPALEAVLPLLVFFTGALTLADLAERSGLSVRAADSLAALARGRSAYLYALVCATCALTTAVLSLDGAVVLMVPLLLALARRHGAPFGPLFLGTVAVANAASIAVPQGNPTNLLLMQQLGLSATSFVAHMAAPGLAAAIACAAGGALLERRALAGAYAEDRCARDARPLTSQERLAAGALLGAAVAAFAAPLTGVPAWWAFAAVAALALALHPRPRPRPVVPTRLAVLVAGLFIVIGALPLSAPVMGHSGALALLGVAGLVGAAAALANNLPASVSVAGLLAAGPLAYAATIGLAVGSLATLQGSAATLIATDLAGPDGRTLSVRQLAPLAVAGVLAATLVLVAQQG